MPFDARAFDRLRRWGGEKLVREMVQLFVAQVPDRLAAARQGAREGDLSSVERAAHALRSSSAQLGAVRMQVLCALVEHSASQGDHESIPRSLGELEREFARYLECLPEGADNVETTG